MKKLLATLLTGVISVSCAVAFTACGGEREGTTVTEDEWKTALSYFTVKFDENSTEIVQLNPRTNYTCELLSLYNDNGQQTYEVITSSDYKNKVFGYLFVNDKTGYCGWKESETFYDVVIRWYTNGNASYNKRARDVSEVFLGIDLELGWDMGTNVYVGAVEIEATNMAQNYYMFTYSEESAEYTATLPYKEGNREIYTFVTAKFECGMLSYLSVDFGEFSNSYSYTYGTTITVPEKLRNLPFGQNLPFEETKT